jgi:predicted AAA+ superfamily ATPase
LIFMENDAMIISRPRHLHRLQVALAESPIVAIIGARQIGKTTLAQQLAQQITASVTVFDLEHPRDLARLEDPLLALEDLQGLVVLDEIQRRPELFPVLRVLADRRPLPARFLVLGSASPDLLQQSSESLAGRIQYYQLGGFALDEINAGAMQQLWVRGGFPAAFLAPSAAASVRWREHFIQTFLERDLPQLGVRVPALTLRRFWTMMAHYHA